MPCFTLDDQTTLDTARAEPVGLVRRLGRALIDEVQRAPQLMRAIKRCADPDKRPVRFLLTGSAHLMTRPPVADSLAGRMEIVELLPLWQSELRNRPCDVLARVLAGKAPAVGALVAAPELVERLAAAGYPEAIRRTSWAGREKRFQDGIRAVLEREVREISKIEYIRRMPWLLRVLAAHSGQRINDSSAAPPWASDNGPHRHTPTWCNGSIAFAACNLGIRMI